MSPPVSEVTRLAATEAHEKTRAGYAYLDVRTEVEFAEGHAPGAYNIPWALARGGSMVDNPDFLRVVAAHFPRDAKLVVGCRSGGRSLRAAQALLVAGFTSVVELRAGWDGARDAFGQIQEPGWSRVGLPVEAGAPFGKSYADLSAAIER
jgi:rhodanese-related sulfurtransferase